MADDEQVHVAADIQPPPVQFVPGMIENVIKASGDQSGETVQVAVPIETREE